jgi:hypothetical protein
MSALRGWVLLSWVAAGAAGCGQAVEDQSFKEGMRVICDSPEAVKVQLEAARPPERAAIAVRWVAAHLKNEEARALCANLAPLPPAQKASTLREAATRAGISRCALADVW